MYINSIYKNFYTPQKISSYTQNLQPTSARFCPSFEGDVFILNGVSKALKDNKSNFHTKLGQILSTTKEKIFTSSKPQIVEREEGLANSCLVDTVKMAFINTRSLLEDIDCFDAKDLTQLTEEQKRIMRKGVKSPYFIYQSFSIANDADKYIKEAKSLKSQLEQRFPDGFSVVSVGSSPSVLCDILKLENINVKYLPFSRVLGFVFEPNCKDFKKLYKEADITSDFINNEKNVVFLDYTYSGKCLKAIKAITEEMFDKQKNVHFLSINKDLKLDDEFVELYLKSSNNGAFSFVSPMPNLESLKQYVNHKSIFKPSLPAKLMRFAILDKYGKV